MSLSVHYTQRTLLQLLLRPLAALRVSHSFRAKHESGICSDFDSFRQTLGKNEFSVWSPAELENVRVALCGVESPILVCSCSAAENVSLVAVVVAMNALNVSIIMRVNCREQRVIGSG